MKLCIDCKYYIKQEHNAPTQHKQYCLKLAKTWTSLIDGKEMISYEGGWSASCEYQRYENAGMCGIEGKNWEAK